MKKKNATLKNKNKEKRSYDRGRIFVKIMAGILVALMLLATIISALYVLFI